MENAVMSLITDANALAMIRAEWSAVVKVREHMRKLMTGPVGSIADGALHSVVYNLPLLLAFNVLERALRALKRQRQIPGSSEQLGDLLDMFQEAWPFRCLCFCIHMPRTSPLLTTESFLYLLLHRSETAKAAGVPDKEPDAPQLARGGKVKARPAQKQVGGSKAVRDILKRYGARR